MCMLHLIAAVVAASYHVQLHVAELGASLVYR